MNLFRVRRAGHQHDERRQVVVQRAEAVGGPCAEAGAAGDLVARLHVGDRRLVVDRLGVHAADEAHVVDHLGRVRQQLADPHPALAVLGEFVFRRGDRKAGLLGGHPGKPLTHSHTVGQVLVEILLHLRLVVVEVHLRRAADHVEIDHVLRLGSEMGEVLPHRLGRFRRAAEPIRSHQRTQRRPADGIRPATKKLPPRLGFDPFFIGIHVGPHFFAADFADVRGFISRELYYS